MTVALKVGLDINLEVQIDDSTQQCGDQVQNDDGIGKSSRGHGAESIEKIAWRHT